MKPTTHLLNCGGVQHRLVFDGHSWSIPDHDLSAEAVLHRLGGDRSLCAHVLDEIQAPRLDLLVLVADDEHNPRRRGIRKSQGARTAIGLAAPDSSVLFDLPLELRHDIVLFRIERLGPDPQTRALVDEALAAGADLDAQKFKSLARAISSLSSGVDHTDPDASVLVRFFEDSKLVEIPAKASHRLIVLRRLVGEFSEGASYTEREVNEVLRAFHPDVAALRRYLVDENLMVRADGIYRRTELR